MKKKLLLVALVLAILTSLTAGTLAVYTRTVVENKTVEAKKFAFSASGQIAGGHETINLAPTESMDYLFSISNTDENGAVAEVPLKYDVTIDYSAALAQMPGLSAKLFLGGEDVGTYSNGKITYSTTSKEDDKFLQEYKVVVTWLNATSAQGHDEQTDSGIAAASVSAGLKLTVVATQVVSTDE